MDVVALLYGTGSHMVSGNDLPTWLLRGEGDVSAGLQNNGARRK